MYFLTNLQQSTKLTLPGKSQQKFTIGRTPQNSLQILDSTVSKNHAIIYYFGSEKKHVLQDLGSINGTYVNGVQISGTKTYLKHNDEIQFGKNDQKYIMKLSNPQPEKKGKINFKDYHFELQDQIDVKPVLQNKKIQKDQVNVQGKTQTGWNKINSVGSQGKQVKNKQKFQRAIKIPKFEQFLQIQGQQLDQGPSWQRTQMQVDKQQVSVKKWQRSTQIQRKKGAVKLPQLNRVQLSEQDKINKQIIQRKKQLQRAQKQALLRKTQEQKRMIEQRLRLQIARAQQQQQLLRQKYQIQRRAEQQEKNLIREKMLLQQRGRLQEKQARQRQQLRQLQLKQKQEALLGQMMKAKQLQMLKLKQKEQEIMRQVQQQKKREVSEIKEQQTQKRIQNQDEIKKVVENRKKQLQLEAEALTRQYENIYKDTIKKLKLNIESKQYKVNDIEDDIQKLAKENNQLQNAIDVQDNQQQMIKLQYNDITGRNKAFLLYASHLQTKIDTLKVQVQRTSIKDPSRTSLEIKDSLVHSRKLLNMKINQQRELQQQVKEAFISLNLNSPQAEEYLATILTNYQEIQRLKEIYFEFLEEEKIIQNKWDLELEDNNALEERLRNVRKDIEGNKKKISQNLNDNLKKLTEQRLHMLKMMYHLPEQKKNAAKYLIEQMLNIEQQNKAIILDNETTHTKITQLIISIEQKKNQNQQLSQMLFGNNHSSHHFDNMKDEINRLVEEIQHERDQFKIDNLLKTGQDLRQLENKLYLEARREKKLKEQIKSAGYVVPLLNTQKNPLVFFGKILLKKDNQLAQSEQEEKTIQKKLIQIKNKVSTLSEKKAKLNHLLQDYKQKQLRNVRDYLK